MILAMWVLTLRRISTYRLNIYDITVFCLMVDDQRKSLHFFSLATANLLILSLKGDSMYVKINEEVSVVMYYSARRRMALPHLINWKNRDYVVGKIGYHHTTRDGQTLHHIFELTDKESSLWFRLNLDTSNLHWVLEAVSDGMAT